MAYEKVDLWVEKLISNSQMEDDGKYAFERLKARWQRP